MGKTILFSFTLLPALKADNSCKAYNFRIKVGNVQIRGGFRGGGGRTRRAPPPKIGKNMIFLAQNRDFLHEIPPKFRAPPKIGKIRFFWRKIVIFHTKYPNNFRAALRSAQFF